MASYKYEPKDDYYAFLSIDEKATTEEIKDAYRKKARLLHPDGHRAPDLANEATVTLNEAYRVLSDPLERRKYDGKRADHILQVNEKLIQRRVDEALALARRQQPKPARGRSQLAKRYGAKPIEGIHKRVEDMQRRVDGRNDATRQRLDAYKAPTALVPEHQRGTFTRLAETKVEELARKDRAWEAFLLGVGAAMLDAWITSPPTRQR